MGCNSIDRTMDFDSVNSGSISDIPANNRVEKMPNKKFPKEVLQDLFMEDSFEWAGEKLEVVADRMTSTDRWCVNHRLIFSYGGKLYCTPYSVEAIEIQDERPFEYDGPEISCQEVEPYTVTVVRYRPVK